MTRTVSIDHLPRIEGHAGITVVMDGARIERVEFDVFEGIRLFEGLLKGRKWADVPGIVSRICAICSHGHAITALMALEKAFEIDPSAQTRQLRELAFHGSSIESHALHLFCLALPDFVGHPSVISLAGVQPDTVRIALRLKKLGNTIQEVIGGRAVHPVNYVIGGFGRLPDLDRMLMLRDALRAGQADCEMALDVLRGVAVPAIVDEPIRCAALVPDAGSFFFGRTIHLSDGAVVPVNEYRAATNERAVPHAHAKHSTQDGRSFLVGALARLTLNGNCIDGRARQVWQEIGPALPCRNILMNSVAQFVELTFSIEHALELVNRLVETGIADERPVVPSPRACEGTAASEVPRGTLYHHYELDAAGEVVAADVITPTAQNLANLEDQLRAAVRDAGDADDETLRHRLEMVARAYDPCVSCSVHAMKVQSARC